MRKMEALLLESQPIRRYPHNCKENRRFCLFYCENFKIDLDSSQPNFYASTVNYGLTLLERLYTLLYFVREEDTDEV